MHHRCSRCLIRFGLPSATGRPTAGLLLGFVVIFCLPASSEAQLLRRRRRAYSNYNSGVATTVAVRTRSKPIVGLLRKRSRVNRSEYDYNWAARRDWHQTDAKPMLFADKVRVKVLLKEEHVPVVDKLRVRATWYYLHKTKTLHTSWVRLQQEGNDYYYDIGDLQEGRLVKVVSDFYRQTEDQPPSEAALHNASFIKNDQGNYKFVGRMHVPYFGVTSSKSSEELKRRARIVSFGFSQWYADEAYGGRLCNYDCYSFYQSSTSGELAGFKLKPISRSSVPNLSKEGKRFHGDYLIKPGHFGMALCYDEDTGNFCTLEGNYALNGPYRINIDPTYHGLHTWSSIMTIAQQESSPSS